MEAVVDENVATEDLKRFEKLYNDQVQSGHVTDAAQFEYSWCLVRSAYSSDMKKGLALLEDLFRRTKDEQAKRDYLYYLAVGCIRLKEYDKALKYTNAILYVEPKNHQAQQLKELIEKRMKKDGLIGMAVLGGAAAVGVAGIVGLGALIGIAAAKKK